MSMVKVGYGHRSRSGLGHVGCGPASRDGSQPSHRASHSLPYVRPPHSVGAYSAMHAHLCAGGSSKAGGALHTGVPERHLPSSKQVSATAGHTQPSGHAQRWPQESGTPQVSSVTGATGGRGAACADAHSSAKRTMTRIELTAQ